MISTAIGAIGFGMGMVVVVGLGIYKKKIPATEPSLIFSISMGVFVSLLNHFFHILIKQFESANLNAFAEDESLMLVGCAVGLLISFREIFKASKEL